MSSICAGFATLYPVYESKIASSRNFNKIYPMLSENLRQCGVDLKLISKCNRQEELRYDEAREFLLVRKAKPDAIPNASNMTRIYREIQSTCQLFLIGKNQISFIDESDVNYNETLSQVKILQCRLLLGFEDNELDGKTLLRNSENRIRGSISDATRACSRNLISSNSCMELRTKLGEHYSAFSRAVAHQLRYRYDSPDFHLDELDEYSLKVLGCEYGEKIANEKGRNFGINHDQESFFYVYKKLVPSPKDGNIRGTSVPRITR